MSETPTFKLELEELPDATDSSRNRREWAIIMSGTGISLLFLMIVVAFNDYGPILWGPLLVGGFLTLTWGLTAWYEADRNERYRQAAIEAVVKRNFDGELAMAVMRHYEATLPRVASAPPLLPPYGPPRGMA